VADITKQYHEKSYSNAMISTPSALHESFQMIETVVTIHLSAVTSCKAILEKLMKIPVNKPHFAHETQII
jgi:hypothetical protein